MIILRERQVIDQLTRDNQPVGGKGNLRFCRRSIAAAAGLGGGDASFVDGVSRWCAVADRARSTEGSLRNETLQAFRMNNMNSTSEQFSAGACLYW